MTAFIDVSLTHACRDIDIVVFEGNSGETSVRTLHILSMCGRDAAMIVLGMYVYMYTVKR